MKKRTFDNPQLLNEMLCLRLEGWALRDLSYKYKCNVTTIRDYCKQHGLPAEIPLLPNPVIVFKQVHTDWNGERINRGKSSYKDYLEEAKRRKYQQTRTIIRTKI